jgi:hypothetical protein
VALSGSRPPRAAARSLPQGSRGVRPSSPPTCGSRVGMERRRHGVACPGRTRRRKRGRSSALFLEKLAHAACSAGGQDAVDQRTGSQPYPWQDPRWTVVRILATEWWRRERWPTSRKSASP